MLLVIGCCGPDSCSDSPLIRQISDRNSVLVIVDGAQWLWSGGREMMATRFGIMPTERQIRQSRQDVRCREAGEDPIFAGSGLSSLGGRGHERSIDEGVKLKKR